MPRLELTVRYKTAKGEPGSDIDIAGRVFAFRPDAAGRHVADVDEATAALLLASGLFVPVGEAAKSPAEPLPDLAGASVEALRRIHLAETGTQAPPRAGAANLIRRIEAARAAKGAI